MPGVAHISASITAPGVITQVGDFMRMQFGELDGSRSQRGEAFLAMCTKAGIEGTFSEAILTPLWMKFILLASNAGMMSLARQPIGNLRDDPDMRPLFLAAYGEVADVGRAKGVALPADAVEKTVALTGSMPAPMKASMALDLERGNRLEVPWLSGKVVELGKQYGIPTPTHAMMHAMLKPYAMGKAGVAAPSIARSEAIAKQSSFLAHGNRKLDCFAFARNDDWRTHVRIPAARYVRVMQSRCSLPEERAQGKTGR